MKQMVIESCGHRWSTTVKKYDFRDKNVITLFTVKIFIKFNRLKLINIFLKLLELIITFLKPLELIVQSFSLTLNMFIKYNTLIKY